jgi:hypothetical protein
MARQATDFINSPADEDVPAIAPVTEGKALLARAGAS